MVHCSSHNVVNKECFKHVFPCHHSLILSLLLHPLHRVDSQSHDLSRHSLLLKWCWTPSTKAAAHSSFDWNIFSPVRQLLQRTLEIMVQFSSKEQVHLQIAEAMVMSSNWTLSRPRVCLNILSINNTNNNTAKNSSFIALQNTNLPLHASVNSIVVGCRQEALLLLAVV